MVAIKTADLTQDFRNVADRVTAGEKVIISRPRNENLVLITEKEYNKLTNNVTASDKEKKERIEKKLQSLELLKGIIPSDIDTEAIRAERIAKRGLQS